MRVYHLIEHKQGAPVFSTAIEQFAQPDILQRLDFGNKALMRRIGRHHSPQIGDIGIGDGKDRRQIKRAERFACAPDLPDDAFRIGKRRNNGVTTPESRPVAVSLPVDCPCAWECFIAQNAMAG